MKQLVRDYAAELAALDADREPSFHAMLLPAYLCFAFALGALIAAASQGVGP